jgi:anthranilate synthase component I
VQLQPGRETFEAAYAAGRPQVVWTRVVDDLETPVSAYLKIGLGRPFAFLFEAVEGGAWRGRYSIITLDPDLVWRCRGDRAEIARGEAVAQSGYQTDHRPALDSLRAVIAEAEIELPSELPPMSAGLFGALGYDMIRLAEPVGPAKPDPLELPDAVMTRPSIVAVFDAIAQEILLITPVRPDGRSAEAAWAAANGRLKAVRERLATPLPRPSSRPEPAAAQPLVSPVSRTGYRQVVDTAKRYIEAGDIFQVVPSHRFRAPFTLPPFACYRALRRLNPSPFLFFLDFGDFQLAGSSPEILVRLRNGKATIRPIAGTRPRGATPEEDQQLEQELLADPKERSEHLMLLDLGRNDVGRIVKLGDAGRNSRLSGAPRVRVTDSFAIERYSTVMHIVSNVEGDVTLPVDPVDVILTALPAGTLSGAPKVRAMQIIDELEQEKRGMAYAGAAGYISARGEVDTCIVLRTALFKDGMMYVQAGGGVVADSDPDAEYDETLHKSRALRRAAEEAWRFA